MRKIYITLLIAILCGGCTSRRPADGEPLYVSILPLRSLVQGIVGDDFTVRARDEQDTHRAVDPLRAAEDAVTVDSTHLTFDEVVEAILRIVADKTGGAWA